MFGEKLLALLQTSMSNWTPTTTTFPLVLPQQWAPSNDKLLFIRFSRSYNTLGITLTFNVESVVRLQLVFSSKSCPALSEAWAPAYAEPLYIQLLASVGTDAAQHYMYSGVDVGWQRRCKTCQSLRELYNQGTVSSCFSFGGHHDGYRVRLCCAGWRILTPHKGNDRTT